MSENVVKQPVVAKGSKSSFSALQTVMLLLATLVISVAGWYVVGKQFFWLDVDIQRVNQQVEFFEQKISVEPNVPAHRIGLGYAYFLKGQNDKAKKEFYVALELDKNYFDAYYNLGLVFHEEKKYDEALDVFEKCVEISPKDFKGHLRKGMAYRELGMYDDALAAMNQASTLTMRNADIVYQIGTVIEAKGDIEGAREIYKEALNFDPLYDDAIKALDRLK